MALCAFVCVIISLQYLIPSDSDPKCLKFIDTYKCTLYTKTQVATDVALRYLIVVILLIILFSFATTYEREKSRAKRKNKNITNYLVCSKL